MQPDPHYLAQIYSLTAPAVIQALAENVWLIRAEGREYALKVYAPSALLDHHRYEHWIILALSVMRLSFELPTPIRGQHGGTFERLASGEIWTLTPKLSGDRMKPNDPDQAYAVGAALAELHRALAKLPSLNRPSTQSLREPRLAPHLQLLFPPSPAALGLGDTPESLHRYRRFQNTVIDLQTPPAPNADLSWHLIHGDFFGANILYNGDVVSGVLDFKAAHPDYRAREFAVTLLQVTNDLGPLFWGTGRSFVEGYASMLKLTRAEIDHVPRFIREAQADTVMKFATLGQAVHAAQALRYQEEVSAWLELEQDRLNAMLRGVFLGE